MAVTQKVVDFTNVKEQGNFNTKRVPAGDYLAKVVKVEDAETKADKEFQYLFTIKLVKFSQYAYPYYCKLQENQLWKLRNILTAGGINVPKKRVKLDPSKVVGKTIGVTMEDDEYDGKEKSVVQAVFPAADLDDADLVDEGEADPDEAPEDDVEDEVGTDKEVEADEDEADQFEAMDRNDLKRFILAADADAKFRKSESDDDLRTRARAVPAAADDEDEDLEELDISDL